MERSNIVVIMDELETRDPISRALSKTDRRRVAPTATVRGRRLHDTAVAGVRRNEARLLGGLTGRSGRRSFFRCCGESRPLPTSPG